MQHQPNLPCCGGFLYVCAAVAATLFIVKFWDGGTLETEAIVFVQQYTSERPLLAKIFHAYANDFSTIQARELSYLCDYVDATTYKTVIAGIKPELLVPPSALII